MPSVACLPQPTHEFLRTPSIKPCGEVMLCDPPCAIPFVARIHPSEEFKGTPHIQPFLLPNETPMNMQVARETDPSVGVGDGLDTASTQTLSGLTPEESRTRSSGSRTEMRTCVKTMTTHFWKDLQRHVPIGSSSNLFHASRLAQKKVTELSFLQSSAAHGKN